MSLPRNSAEQAAAAIALLHQIATRHAPVALASSFGAEDMALTDLTARHALPITIFTLDTGRLPGETYALIDRVREHYRLPTEVHYPDASRHYLLRHTTREVRAGVERIDHRWNVSTQEREPSTTDLCMNDLAHVALAQPIFPDRYAENRATRIFILIDEATNNTVAAGLMQ